MTPQPLPSDLYIRGKRPPGCIQYVHFYMLLTEAQQKDHKLVGSSDLRVPEDSQDSFPFPAHELTTPSGSASL
jgi:hypothetical protein